MNKPAMVIGIDFGTDAVRTLVVDTQTGDETASALFEYPWWKAGLYNYVRYQSPGKVLKTFQ